MLEKLIESTDNKSHQRRIRTIFATIGTAVAGVFIAGLVFSIFSTNLAMGSEEFDLSRLIAPAALPETKPPAPEKQAPEKTPQKTAAAAQTTRVHNIQRLDEIPIKAPSRISTTPNPFRARPKGAYQIGSLSDIDGSPGKAEHGIPGGTGPATGKGDFAGAKPVEVRLEKQPVASSTPPPVLTPAKPVTTSGGVVNGKAINLVMPVRPPHAVAVGILGSVHVNVLISETGKVESASADSGPAMLRNAAVTAALRSTFKPTTLSDQPVKVRGIIIYNFK